MNKKQPQPVPVATKQPQVPAKGTQPAGKQQTKAPEKK